MKSLTELFIKHYNSTYENELIKHRLYNLPKTCININGKNRTLDFNHFKEFCNKYKGQVGVIDNIEYKIP